MKKLFEGIQYLFEELAFLPMNAFRALELENWWAASAFNWMFMFIGMAAFVYFKLRFLYFIIIGLILLRKPLFK